MKKILFITVRNIVTTCGELRLIKNRAESFFKDYGYVTDYLALVTKKDKSRCESLDYGSSLTYYEYDKKNVFTYFIAQKAFLKELKKMLNNGEYDLIVISGSMAFKYVNFVKMISNGVRVFADIHGAAEELVEFPKGGLLNRIKTKLYYKLFKFYEKKHLSHFDDYLVVSNGLKQYVYDEYGIKNNVHIVPCATRVERYDVCELQEFRKNAREKYNIKDNEILFVYSGGVSPWQCIEQTVEIFESIKRYDTENLCKLLILSGDYQYIQKYKKEYIIVDSLPAELIPLTLPCADFAFLLRGDYVTNNVAYPNKFLEYVSAGLRVIATPFVYDVAEQIREYGIGYVLKNVTFDKEILNYCFKSDFCYAEDFDQRNRLLNNISFKTRLSFLEK